MESFPKRIILPHPVRESKNQTTLPILYRGMMGLGALSFLLAVVTGIWRVALTRGFLLPSIPLWWPPHGHLIVGSFLATLILLERMIALRTPALIWVPYVYAVTSAFLHTNSVVVRIFHFVALGGWLIHRWMAIRQYRSWEKPVVESMAFVTLSLALNFPGGLLSGLSAALAALAFAVATILVERMEIPLKGRKKLSRMILFLLMGWLLLWNTAVWFHFPGLSEMGALTFLLALLVCRIDPGLRISLRGSELHDFLRKALQFAYAWLMVGSLSMLAWNYLPAAVAKDFILHSLALGFIFSMILGHAPLILPAALGGLPMAHPRWILFFLFQAITLLRLAGDLIVVISPPLWAYTGWITGTAHVALFILYMRSVLTG